MRSAFTGLASLVRRGCVGVVAGAFLASSAPAAAGELPAAIQVAIASAGAHGVPQAPLLEKAREGMAKGVDEARVVAAITALGAQMEAASTTLGALATGPERDDVLAAAAYARQSGVSDASVRLVASGDAATRAPSIRALTDLVALGFPEDKSAALAISAARSGHPGENVDALAGAAATLLAQGVPPGQVLETVGRGNGHGISDAPAYGAGGKNGKEPNGKGLDNAPGQQKK